MSDPGNINSLSEVNSIRSLGRFNIGKVALTTSLASTRLSSRKDESDNARGCVDDGCVVTANCDGSDGHEPYRGGGGGGGINIIEGVLSNPGNIRGARWLPKLDSPRSMLNFPSNDEENRLVFP
jgi:hypothetical protein